jgi:uncharacterized protein YbjT (DUF2867 family)
MRIVVIGGSGLIGRKLVERLRRRGHEVVAATPASGVDTLTGRGLAEALAGAQVVVDVANSPSFEDEAVLSFFRTSGRNLLAAERAARYFGAELNDTALIPADKPRMGPTHFEGWLGRAR